MDMTPDGKLLVVTSVVGDYAGLFAVPGTRAPNGWMAHDGTIDSIQARRASECIPGLTIDSLAGASGSYAPSNREAL